MGIEAITAAVASDPVSDFVIQLLATGVGAALGFGGALIISSRGKKDDKDERKKNTIAAIHEELKGINDAMNALAQQPAAVTWDAAKREFNGIWVSTLTPAFQSCVNAGDFTLLDTKLQTEISNVYLSIGEYDLFSKQRMEFPFTILMQSTECNIEAAKIVKNVNFAMDKLRILLPPLLPKLEK